MHLSENTKVWNWPGYCKCYQGVSQHLPFLLSWFVYLVCIQKENCALNGMPNVALFDIFIRSSSFNCIFVYLDLCSFLLYSFCFYSIFDHFYVIFNDLYAIVFHYYSMTTVYVPSFSFVFYTTIFVLYNRDLYSIFSYFVFNLYSFLFYIS